MSFDRTPPPMRDWIADWRKWSPAERILAVSLAAALAVILPLGIAISAGHPHI